MKAYVQSGQYPMKAYVQSGQYHTIVESRVHLTWYQSHTLNHVRPFGEVLDDESPTSADLGNDHIGL